MMTQGEKRTRIGEENASGAHMAHSCSRGQVFVRVALSVLLTDPSPLCGILTCASSLSPSLSPSLFLSLHTRRGPFAPNKLSDSELYVHSV